MVKNSEWKNKTKAVSKIEVGFLYKLRDKRINLKLHFALLVHKGQSHEKEEQQVSNSD